MQELNDFLASWQTDNLGLKPVFEEYRAFLDRQPGVALDFRARPGISYSLRARKDTGRDLFVLVDVVDDEPENRWLSVCFYADMVDDPDELGDLVPAGLNDQDAICFNLDEDNKAMAAYIQDRLKQAANRE